MKNTMIAKDSKKAFKAGIYVKPKMKILTNKETYEALKHNKLPNVKGVPFAVIEEHEIDGFKKNGYYITRVATTNLYMVVNQNICSIGVAMIEEFLRAYCVPIVECECIGIQGGVITLIGRDGEIKHFKQEGLRDRTRVQKLIRDGKVSNLVLGLYEIPKWISLTSESKDVSLRRSFKQ